MRKRELFLLNVSKKLSQLCHVVQTFTEQIEDWKYQKEMLISLHESDLGQISGAYQVMLQDLENSAQKEHENVCKQVVEQYEIKYSHLRDQHADFIKKNQEVFDEFVQEALGTLSNVQNRLNTIVHKMDSSVASFEQEFKQKSDFMNESKVKASADFLAKSTELEKESAQKNAAIVQESERKLSSMLAEHEKSTLSVRSGANPRIGDFRERINKLRLYAEAVKTQISELQWGLASKVSNFRLKEEDASSYIDSLIKTVRLFTEWSEKPKYEDLFSIELNFKKETEEMLEKIQNENLKRINDKTEQIRDKNVEIMADLRKRGLPTDEFYSIISDLTQEYLRIVNGDHKTNDDEIRASEQQNQSDFEEKRKNLTQKLEAELNLEFQKQKSDILERIQQEKAKQSDLVLRTRALSKESSSDDVFDADIDSIKHIKTMYMGIALPDEVYHVDPSSLLNEIDAITQTIESTKKEHSQIVQDTVKKYDFVLSDFENSVMGVINKKKKEWSVMESKYDERISKLTKFISNARQKYAKIPGRIEETEKIEKLRGILKIKDILWNNILQGRDQAKFLLATREHQYNKSFDAYPTVGIFKPPKRRSLTRLGFKPTYRRSSIV